MAHTQVLDGESLMIEEFYRLMYDDTIKIKVSESAWDKVKASRAIVDQLVQTCQVSYGINTGFGSLKDTIIPADQLVELQHNLIKSHAVGCGTNIPLSRVRGMLALRINTLVKGYSGVSVNLIERLVEFFNLGIFSPVPEKGSCGASGDLIPLSHLVLGYMAFGELYDPTKQTYRDAKSVLNDYKLSPLVLSYKEGLGICNGTQFITVYAAEAVYLAEQLFNQSQTISALTLEALRGTFKAFDQRISDVRLHPGQARVSEMLRENLDAANGGSERHQKYGINNVQDAYSLRAMPQVHGVLYDTIMMTKKVITTEMNSATDNPLVFPDGDIISGGNFHGQYPGTYCDYLSIALTTYGNISERRIERLVNGSLSKLPSFLIHENPGVNSGLMLCQYNCAALSAENRCKANPASVHSIPTCENQEDMVSMGAYASRKTLEILENVYHIVAIELFCAFNAYEFLPEKTTDKLEKVVKMVREHVEPVTKDRYMKPDIDKIKQMLFENKFVSN